MLTLRLDRLGGERPDGEDVGKRPDLRRAGAAAATEPGRAKDCPGRDRRRLEPAVGVCDPRPGDRVPPIAAVRVGDERTVRDGTCPRQEFREEPRRCAVDADRHDAGVIAEGHGIGDRFAGGCGRRVPARVAQPGRDVHLVEQPDQDLRLADGRDRLEREQVRTGFDQGLHPGPVKGGERLGTWVVVAAVLGTVGQHRAIWAHRARHQQRSGVGLAVVLAR